MISQETGEDNPKVDTLVEFIREGHFDPKILFFKLWAPIFSRGDVVKRIDRQHVIETILELRIVAGTILYTTNMGDKVPSQAFELVRKADKHSLAYAQECTDEEDAWE